MGPTQPAGKGQPSRRDPGALGPEVVARQLSDLARRLQAEGDPGLMLDEIVRAAVELIPGVDEGSISVITGRRQVVSQHASGTLPEQVDAVQEEVGQGPCLDAAYEHLTVRVSNMAQEKRWPEFSSRALALGAASMLSFQLYVEHDNLGALNLYSRQPDSFDDDSEHIGLLFASHAAIAFAGAEKVRHLTIAVSRRDRVGQAKGILMERFKISADQAFALLVRVSQDHNLKLYDLAEDLTRTGHLEQPRPPAH